MACSQWRGSAGAHGDEEHFLRDLFHGDIRLAAGADIQ